MREESDVQGNVAVVPEAPSAHAPSESPGIGTAALDGIDNLGNMLIDALDDIIGKTAGAVMALGGISAASTAGDTGRYQDPGYDQHFASATPITPVRASAIEAPGQGQAITLAVSSPHEAREAELGTMVAQAFPTKMQSRETSMMM